MNKNIRLLLFAKWISNFGTQLHSLAFPIIVYNQTHSSTILSLAFIAETLPWLFIGPIIPHILSKKMPDKSILVLCDLMRFLIVIGILNFIKIPYIVLCLIFFLGCFNSIYGSFRTSIIKSNTDDLTLTKTIGISLGVDDLINMLAPAFGALLISIGILPTIFLMADSVSYLLSAFLILKIQSNEDKHLSESESNLNFYHQATEGFHTIWNNIELKWLVILEGIRSLVEGISIPLLILYVTQILLKSETTFAWSRAISSIFSILASLMYIKFEAKLAKGKFVNIGTAFLTISLLSMAFFNEIYVFYLASAFLGIGMGIRQLVSENLLIKLTDNCKLPQVTSAFNAFISSLYLLGYGISIFQREGISVVYFFAISGFLLLLGYFYKAPSTLKHALLLQRELEN